MSGLLLSVAYDFASTGIGAALVVLVTSPGPARGPLHTAWPAVQGTAGALLPIGISPLHLPSTVAGQRAAGAVGRVAARAGAVLAAAIALGIVTYFPSPAPTVLAIRVGRRTTSARGVSWLGLTGIPRLLLHDTLDAEVGGVLGLAVTAFIVVMSGSIDMRTRLENPAVNLLLCYLGLVTALVARFSGMLRHLRALPLGAARLTALLVAWRAIILVSLWVAFAIVRYLALGDGPSLHHAFTLAGLIGVGALVQAALISVHRCGSSRGVRLADDCDPGGADGRPAVGAGARVSGPGRPARGRVRQLRRAVTQLHVQARREPVRARAGAANWT